VLNKLIKNKKNMSAHGYGPNLNKKIKSPPLVFIIFFLNQVSNRPHILAIDPSSVKKLT
jgi:hypothetical protein